MQEIDRRKEGMTPRERIKAVMHFRKPDVLPWIESYSPQTILRWISEGLPIDRTAVVEESPYCGMMFSTATFSGFDVHSYFGTSAVDGYPLRIDSGPIPKFKQRILKHDEKYIDSINQIGQTIRKSTESKYALYSMPMFLEFPVKNRQSWEEYKDRLNPSDPRRYPIDWEKEEYIEVFEMLQDRYTTLLLNGFYGFGGQLMGIVNFNLMFYKDPELIRDMAEYWEYFTIETMRDAVEAMKDTIDAIWWWEDFAEKHGPLISPRLFRDFLLPHYRNVTDFLKKNKIDRVVLDSDGNTSPILDLMIEAGITGHWPLEVASGMDAITLRRKYGNELFIMGNLDKRELVKGGEHMKKEIDSKIPILKEMGGYIPSLDHDIPPDFTLDRYREYAEYMKKQLPY